MKTLLNPLTGHRAFGSGMVAIATLLLATLTAAALRRTITQVRWTTVNKATGFATGKNAWAVTNIPLVANKTNLVIVTATTTSWAPAFGGNTTFNDTLTVVSMPAKTTACAWPHPDRSAQAGPRPQHLRNAQVLRAGTSRGPIRGKGPALLLPGFASVPHC